MSGKFPSVQVSSPDKPIGAEIDCIGEDAKRLVTVPATEKRKGRETKPKITTTAPENILRHNISDDELERLMTGCKKEDQSGTFWALVGAAIAALPSAGESLWNAYVATPAVPLTVFHLLEVMIIVAAAAGAWMAYTPTGTLRNGVADLGAEIRARQAK